MAFSLGSSTPARHCPPARLHPPPVRPRLPPARRNAFHKSPRVISALRREEEGRDLGRRALLAAGLVGSSFLRLREAVAAELSSGSEDAYVAVSFMRRRPQMERLQEYKPPAQSAGEPTAGAPVSELQESGSSTYTDLIANKVQETEEINQEVLSSSQNVSDIGKVEEKPSSTQNVTAPVQKMMSPVQNSPEETLQEEPSASSLFSALNAVGILGSGVLGGLYAISQKDKAAIQSTVDSMKSLLEEKEAAKRLLEKTFEEKMLSEQEQHKKHIKTLQEAEAIIAKQLASANATVSALGKELVSEKNIVQEIQLELDQLRVSLPQVRKEKRELEDKLGELTTDIGILQDRASLLASSMKERDQEIEELSSSLAMKRSECEKLTAALAQTKDDYKSSCTSRMALEKDIAQTKEELTAMNSKIIELKDKLKLVTAEREDAKKDFSKLREEYNSLKMASTKKSEMDSKLLSKKDNQICHLEEKLNHVVKEAADKQALASTLKKEKDGFEAMLKEETDKVKNLEREIQTVQASLKASNVESSKLSDLLKESRDGCEALKSELSLAQVKFSEQQNALVTSLDESRAVSDRLCNELAVAKEDLSNAKQEFLMVSNELTASLALGEKLKAELLEANKEFEAANFELQKGEAVANLHKELEGSQRQIEELLTAQKTLESHLGKASTSLDEMNTRASMLSLELEGAQSLNAQLLKERQSVEDSLVEQRNASQEALKNIENLQSDIFRLGAERESLLKKNEKLEEEIASAKGEILRLRQQANTGSTSFNDNRKTSSSVEASATPIPARRTWSGGKRRDHTSK